MLWITGCKGLLGAALVRASRQAVLATGKEVDIGDLAAVRQFAEKHPGITHLVNCAAFSQVDAAEEFKEMAYHTNARGPGHLAIVAREMGAKLIHISTDYVFDGKGRTPLVETAPTGPLNTYGKTKWEGEQKVLEQGACVIRTSWLFGSGGQNFVSKLLKLLQTQRQIRLTDDQWSRFTYAPDLAQAILSVLDRTGLYQYANRGVATKYEFGVAMREEACALGYPIVTDEILSVPGASFPSPCERPIYSAFDTSKMERIVNIRHWRDALKEFLCEQMPAYL
ncbi:MAG: dTDP-4-dehydrorhamnose reductase [Verrucomicrobia bacterium]|nr:dTDP-4-dehydrorhamnose reductase [Verrucomicrobiota bacterium]MBU6446375.1 dTDP-4-dehydrorhamnose reductase [Verrucomicrobiota bacterium]MDE3047184.1 dTDP-4-dehydrorhamnose reductase [Verrucomicrobiota bacterium]